MVKAPAQQEVMTKFLSALFSWRWEIGGADTGFYAMGFLGDAQVIAIGQNAHGLGLPSVYMHCDDIQATVTAAKAAGATIFMEPMTIMEAGTLAMGVDPGGAVFGMWQGNLMPGFGTSNVDDAFCWFDCMTAEPLAIGAFYAEVFGLQFQPMGNGGMLLSDGALLASVSQAPAGIPALWNPIVKVTSVDDAEQRAGALGCDVLMSRMPVPGGLASAMHHADTGLTVTVFEGTV